MNYRKKLEEIVAVICRYLPPDGISREQAMNEIIDLIEPFPENDEQETISCTCGEPHVLMVVHSKDAPCFIYGTNAWRSLTDGEIRDVWLDIHNKTSATDAFARAIEAKLKEKNGG